MRIIHQFEYRDNISLTAAQIGVSKWRLDYIQENNSLKEAKAILKESKSHSKTSINLNEAIGTIERTYARAINKEKDWTGSLFRKEAKAKDGWINEFITLKKLNGKLDYRFKTGTNYGFNCLNYIHKNPVEAGLISDPVDWKYSSAKDYAGLRNGNLCNLKLGRDLLDFI